GAGARQSFKPFSSFRFSAHTVASRPRGPSRLEFDADHPRGAESRGRAQATGPRYRLLHPLLRKLQRAVSIPEAWRIANSGNFRPGLARTPLHLHILLSSSRGPPACRTNTTSDSVSP